MKIETTKLDGVLLLTPDRFGDSRGFFSESWNKRRMAEHGIDLEFVQDNHSLSSKVGTIRGLHYQTPPHAQAKLVRCGRGALFDVALDIRVGSPTFGQWVGAELTAENGRQLLVPVGFAHGFVTRAPDTEIVYKCTDYFAPDCDRAIAHNDPVLGIDWGVSIASFTLSDKDASAPLLADIEPVFAWDGRQ
ncbi:dTDP-4-dehydrorhamnose 3,5-epimerase [Shimia sagamensis]|uniref:dTDP-4-dehydrorhamnose 3,5-epimerase n=1 Tax=Shimia sagamensis TaxID=1566352 RepID=A0ABY1NB84_9RHOB|nr:dTDP-4-dehydrorhamnose 3,5-epimerase [Shimia sagamensis]SMP05454.1 dTDP-4-dehydrorhamnose 3,5-epimerase [Shimia sagamensis]